MTRANDPSDEPLYIKRAREGQRAGDDESTTSSEDPRTRHMHAVVSLDDGSELIIDEPWADKARFDLIRGLIGSRVTHRVTDGHGTRTQTGVLKSVDDQTTSRSGDHAATPEEPDFYSAYDYSRYIVVTFKNVDDAIRYARDRKLVVGSERFGSVVGGSLGNVYDYTEPGR